MTRVFVRDIIKEEIKRYKIDLDYLLSDTRTGKLTKIRHYIIWRARKETGASFPHLGKIFNRDHTSVLYAYNKTERLYREGGILQIRPAPPAKDVGKPRLDIPLRSGPTPRGLLQLIQVGGKWSASRAE